MTLAMLVSTHGVDVVASSTGDGAGDWAGSVGGVAGAGAAGAGAAGGAGGAGSGRGMGTGLGAPGCRTRDELSVDDVSSFSFP